MRYVHMLLDDDECIDLSRERQLRAVVSLTRTILQNCPGVDDRMAEACARNIVAGLPVLGIREGDHPMERLLQERLL